MTEKSIAMRTPSEYLPQPISQKQAMYLLKTIWPGAPETDIVKAGILCQQYGLNPLMRQVYLIKFGNSWSIVLGIKATRQIAQQALKKRGITYSYADGPRVMSAQERKKILGEEGDDRIWALLLLQDNHGNTFPGYGWWPKSTAVYGAEKGNSQINMAFIRAERNALDKLAPGELPDLDVGDDAYVASDYNAALQAGQKEFDKHVDENIDLLYGDGVVPESAGTEKPSEEPEGSKPPAEQQKPTDSHPGAISKDEELANGIDMGELRRMLTECQWSATDVGVFIKKRYGVTGNEQIKKLSREQAENFLHEVQRRLDAQGKP